MHLHRRSAAHAAGDPIPTAMTGHCPPLGLKEPTFQAPGGGAHGEATPMWTVHGAGQSGPKATTPCAASSLPGVGLHECFYRGDFHEGEVRVNPLSKSGSGVNPGASPGSGADSGAGLYEKTPTVRSSDGGGLSRIGGHPWGGRIVSNPASGRGSGHGIHRGFRTAAARSSAPGTME